MKRWIVLVALFSSSLYAFAPPPVAMIEFDTPGFEGSGCPESGILNVLDQTKMIYEIEFSGFTVDVNSAASTSTRKACHVSIPVTINPGTSVAISRLRYSGVNELSDGAMARTSTEVFFAGTRSPMVPKTFSRTGNFFVDVVFSEAEKSWSSCGARSASLWLSLVNELKNVNETTKSSSKLEGKIIFELEIQRC